MFPVVKRPVAVRDKIQYFTVLFTCNLDMAFSQLKKHSFRDYVNDKQSTSLEKHHTHSSTMTRLLDYKSLEGA